MPKPRPQPVSSDRAFCERTCRTAAALGWRLEEERIGTDYAYRFHAPNGQIASGYAHSDQAAALTSSCRKLVEILC